MMGAHIYSVGIFGDYFSSGLPANFGTQQTANLPSDVAYGASMSMGWMKTGSRWTGSIKYQPSYTGRARFSNIHAFEHSFYSNFTLQLRSRWTMDIAATSLLRDLQRTLFSSSQLSQVASTPATFNGLSSALLSGQFINTGLGSVLTAAPVANSPAANILYGTHFLTVGLSTHVNYNHSERFHISMGVTATRSQSLSQNSSVGSVVAPVQPRSTGGTVNVSAFYGLTPRLTLNASWNAQRSFSHLQGATTYGNSFVQNMQGSLGYLAGSKWLFSMGGGIGYLPGRVFTTTASSAQTGSGFRYLANGSIAYKLYSQTFALQGSRSVSDVYGIGGTTIVIGNLGWFLSRPGSYWGASIDGGYQSIAGTNATSTTLAGWRGMASVHRMLSRRLTVSADYTVLRNTGIYNLVNYAATRSAARLMLTYSFADQTGPTNAQNF
jgi:hypothetical protein